MDIEIKNTEEVISICEQGLKTISPKLEENVNLLNNSLTKIKSSWDSTGQDKQSYVIELEKQIKNITILNSAVVQLFNSILTYANNIKQTSSNTLDVVIGGNFENYQVSSGYDSANQAVNNNNPEKILTQYVNKDSEFNAFAVVDSNGNIKEVERASGTSLNEFIKENGYSLDDIAVDIAKDGQSQVWVSASDLVK